MTPPTPHPQDPGRLPPNQGGDAATRIIQVRHDLRNPLGHILGFAELLLEAARKKDEPGPVAALTSLCQESEQLIPRVTLCLDPRALASGRSDLAGLEREITRFSAEVEAAMARLTRCFPGAEEEGRREDLARIADSARRLGEVASSQLPGLAAFQRQVSPPPESPAVPPAPAPERSGQERAALLGRFVPAFLVECDRLGQKFVGRLFPDVTLLAVGLADLARLTEGLSAEVLVGRLNQVHDAFDQLAQECGMEKVSARHAGCLLAAGLPLTRPDHPRAAAELALALGERIARVPVGWADAPRLQAGLATGPVVAGLVGAHKLGFELWGPTVEEAWRLQRLASPGQILVAGSASERLEGEFRLEDLGAAAAALLGLGQASRLVGPKEGEGG